MLHVVSWTKGVQMWAVASSKVPTLFQVSPQLFCMTLQAHASGILRKHISLMFISLLTVMNIYRSFLGSDFLLPSWNPACWTTCGPLRQRVSLALTAVPNPSMHIVLACQKRRGILLGEWCQHSQLSNHTKWLDNDHDSCVVPSLHDNSQCVAKMGFKVLENLYFANILAYLDGGWACVSGVLSKWW